MRQADQKVIWTIGHSTHSIEEFIDMLHSFQIRRIVDIRMFPGSRRYPHFNKELLEVSMAESNIEYNHMIELGGRRKPRPDSKNTGWRLASFKGYADYMETNAFHMAVGKLEDIGMKQRTAYMCSEAVWWRCHRALVSDYLKIRGWTVMHIVGKGKAQEHPYSSPAKNIGGILSYEA